MLGAAELRIKEAELRIKEKELELKLIEINAEIEQARMATDQTAIAAAGKQQSRTASSLITSSSATMRSGWRRSIPRLTCKPIISVTV